MFLEIPSPLSLYKNNNPNPFLKTVCYLCSPKTHYMTATLNPKVKYIGVDDLDLDLFESQYVVPEGMAYNSYVILDDKIAVMDTAVR